MTGKKEASPQGRKQAVVTTEQVQAVLAQAPDFWQPVVQEAVQAILEVERDECLQAGKYERTDQRAGYRSGYYRRRLITRVGTRVRAVAVEQHETWMEGSRYLNMDLLPRGEEVRFLRFCRQVKWSGKQKAKTYATNPQTLRRRLPPTSGGTGSDQRKAVPRCCPRLGGSVSTPCVVGGKGSKGKRPQTQLRPRQRPVIWRARTNVCGANWLTPSANVKS